MDRQISGSIFNALVAEIDRQGLKARLKATLSAPVKALFDRPPLATTLIPGTHVDEVYSAAFAIAGRSGLRDLSLALLRKETGPLLARLELAVGRTALSGTAIPVRDWLAGARGGFGVDTPVGPIRLEYGYNSLHRGAVFVRVGRWF